MDGVLEVERVTFRQDLAYAAVRNVSGEDGRLFDVRLSLLDDDGSELFFTTSYCFTPEGGSTVLNGALAHCMWYGNPEVTPSSVAISLSSVDPVSEFAPEGHFYLDGEPTFGDEDTSVGWVEGRLCSRSGDAGASMRMDVMVLDADGFPWDEGRGSEDVSGSDGCATFRVGGLQMPASPIVIAYP